MRNSCPYCSSTRTVDLAELDSSESCSGSCSVAVQQVLQTSVVASLHPPARRRIGVRVLCFFLASVLLAWPINLLIKRQIIATHLQATVTEFSKLPVQVNGQVSATGSQPGPDITRVTYELLAVPDMPTILLLLGCALALVVALALDLYQARYFNQTVWGPAYQRWHQSRYCVACTRVYSTVEVQQQPEIEEAFPSVPANPTAA